MRPGEFSSVPALLADNKMISDATATRMNPSYKNGDPKVVRMQLSPPKRQNNQAQMNMLYRGDVNMVRANTNTMNNSSYFNPTGTMDDDAFSRGRYEAVGMADRQS